MLSVVSGYLFACVPQGVTLIRAWLHNHPADVLLSGPLKGRRLLIRCGLSADTSLNNFDVIRKYLGESYS